MSLADHLPATAPRRRSPRKMTVENRRAEVVRLMRGGHPAATLARIYGVDRKTCYRWLWAADAASLPPSARPG